MEDQERLATIPVTRMSMISGVTRTVELPVTPEQLERYEGGGILLQDAFPDLPRADREFIKTGITAQEWEECVIGRWPDDAGILAQDEPGAENLPGNSPREPDLG